MPSPERLRDHVERLAFDLAPRDFAHPNNLLQVAEYIRGCLTETTDRLDLQDYEVDGATFRNVLAHYGPETGERIVVGAHYDTAGPFPGADDNASAVAGLLELGRLLGEHPPDIHVELASYPLEEPPNFYTKNMGSYVHAQSLKKKSANVRLMICLEMIGYFSDEPHSQSFPLVFLRPFYPSEGNFIAVVGKWGLGQIKLVRSVREAMRRASPLPVHSINAPRIVPGIALSDHLNYWHAGYDAVMITDTAFYRNGNYHTPHDLPETLDYERMAHVVKGVHGVIDQA